jgi:hypothetical protein
MVMQSIEDWNTNTGRKEVFTLGLLVSLPIFETGVDR